MLFMSKADLAASHRWWLHSLHPPTMKPCSRTWAFLANEIGAIGLHHPSVLMMMMMMMTTTMIMMKLLQMINTAQCKVDHAPVWSVGGVLISLSVAVEPVGRYMSVMHHGQCDARPTVPLVFLWFWLWDYGNMEGMPEKNIWDFVKGDSKSFGLSQKDAQDEDFRVRIKGTVRPLTSVCVENGC